MLSDDEKELIPVKNAVFRDNNINNNDGQK